MHTFVIAELGLSHEGSRDRWRRLIEVAQTAGADAIKGQWWSSAEAMAKHRGGNLELWQRYGMPLDWLEDIPADKRMCTVFMAQDIDAIQDQVIRYKIGSWESVRGQLLEEYSEPSRRLQKLVIVSTGGWTDRLFSYRGVYQHLHCISEYPTRSDHLRLGTIRKFGLDGLSDHSGMIETGRAAVFAGARIIEAHLRLYETDIHHPDYSVSLSPDDFHLYVHDIREAETWM